MCPEVRNWCYMSRYNALSEERTLQWVVWLKMLKWTPTLFPRLQWSHFVDNKLALKVTVTVCKPHEPQDGGRLLTAVVDGVRHHGLQPPSEAASAVRKEGCEHEAHHTQIHLLGLLQSRLADDFLLPV